MSDFNFYKNVLALSVDDPDGNASVLSDLLLEGDVDRLQNALIAQMHRHPVLASIVCCAGYNFLRELAFPSTSET